MIDAQLPPALALRLRQEGHYAVHAAEFGMQGATDVLIAERAAHDRAILVSKDEDFVAMILRGRFSGPLLWIRLGNVTNRRLWQALEPRLAEIVAAFEAGERVVEFR